MQVKLKVIGGKNDGREIKITIPLFIIGRGEEAHLRPSSDLVSRQHCAINIADGRVTIADMNSRNGTFINGERITEVHVARPGDILRVGRLQFEVVIDVAEPSHKLPKVEGVAQVAARTAGVSAAEGLDEDSITSWLTQPNEELDNSRTTLHDSSQFALQENSTRLFVRSSDIKQSDEPSSGDTPDPSSKSGSFFRKKQAGKLPQRPSKRSDSSTSAADEVLRKFFNRR